MRNNAPHRRRLLCAAISLSLLPLATTSFAQDDSIEEVVVTGSFIRRSEGFTQASSVTQLTAEDLEAEGTLNMGEVISNLAFVNGSASAITNTIQGQDSRNTEIDLRGLGARSTLTLLDGKRLVNENVNALIPTIAIQRMDIVADGAAALYGNEAVAGVVNFVPYTSYDGFKMDTYVEQDEGGDYDEHAVQLLWGGDIGELDVVLAGQFRQSSRLEWAERPYLGQAGLIMSSNAPGNYYTPNRDADGQYDGTRSSSVDPNCAPASERDFYKPGEVASPYGMKLGSNCYFDFGDSRDYREPTSTNQIFGNATWDFSDSVTIKAQGFYTRMYEETYTSTSNPGNSRIGELPAIRGEIPGNPYVAQDSSGNPLYGFDADSNGIPDRGTADLNNDGTPDYLVAGIMDNGIPLMEDVQARRLRPINKTNTVTDGHTSDYDNYSDNLDHIGRWSLEAEFDVPFLEGWQGNASYTYNYREIKWMQNQVYDISEMKKGLNCDVANDVDACYSPFFIVDDADLSSVHVLNAIAARDRESVEDKLGVVDIVLNGQIGLFGYELPGGPIGMAVGYQNRDDTFTNTPSQVALAGDSWIGGTDPEIISSGNRTIDAYFTELSIPVLQNLEFQLAVRYEDFSTGQSSTDPKYGVAWGATDWLTLRATMGDAFIAPTLEQLYNPVSCGLSTVTDRYGPFSAFTTACSGGNAGLENEEAESTSLGFDIELGAFDMHLTWNETEFENRIITTGGQDLMELDFFNFKEATGFTGSGELGEQPSEAQTRAWLASGQSEPRIIRSPDDIYDILQVNTGTSNAESITVEAYDLQAGYNFSIGNFGDIRLGLQATFIQHFWYQDDPTQPVLDGAGEYNANTSAAPELPEIKANLRLGWALGNHSVTSTVHYIDSLPYDGPLYTHMDFFANTFRPANIRETGVKAWTDMDMSYTYRGLSLFNGEAAFTLGARNMFDRTAQSSPEFAGVIGGLQDPLGRVLYGRFTYDF